MLCVTVWHMCYIWTSILCVCVYCAQLTVRKPQLPARLARQVPVLISLVAKI